MSNLCSQLHEPSPLFNRAVSLSQVIVASVGKVSSTFVSSHVSCAGNALEWNSCFAKCVCYNQKVGTEFLPLVGVSARKGHCFITSPLPHLPISTSLNECLILFLKMQADIRKMSATGRYGRSWFVRLALEYIPLSSHFSLLCHVQSFVYVTGVALWMTKFLILVCVAIISEKLKTRHFTASMVSFQLSTILPTYVLCTLFCIVVIKQHNFRKVECSSRRYHII